MRSSAKLNGLKTAATHNGISQARKMNHLKDDVYREMLLLEGNRPGSEMGLALALLRALVASDSLPKPEEFGEWLKAVCPVGLKMIELALGERRGCNPERKLTDERRLEPQDE